MISRTDPMINEDGGHLSVVLLILKDVLTVDAPEHHVVNTRTAFFPNRSCHRFNCFQMRGQRYELILEHPNFQRRKMIRRTDPVILVIVIIGIYFTECYFIIFFLPFWI